MTILNEMVKRLRIVPFGFNFLLTENHRTQSQYDRHRVTKLVLFEFVNNFVALFYIAFIIRDMDMLRSQLQTMLIISQLINHVQEALLPLFVKYYGSKVRKKIIILSFLCFFFSNNRSYNGRNSGFLHHILRNQNYTEFQVKID